jgi:hypothetical protein
MQLLIAEFAVGAPRIQIEYGLDVHVPDRTFERMAGHDFRRDGPQTVKGRNGNGVSRGKAMAGL